MGPGNGEHERGRHDIPPGESAAAAAEAAARALADGPGDPHHVHDRAHLFQRLQKGRLGYFH